MKNMYPLVLAIIVAAPAPLVAQERKAAVSWKIFESEIRGNTNCRNFIEIQKREADFKYAFATAKSALQEVGNLESAIGGLGDFVRNCKSNGAIEEWAAKTQIAYDKAVAESDSALEAIQKLVELSGPKEVHVEPASKSCQSMVLLYLNDLKAKREAFEGKFKNRSKHCTSSDSEPKALQNQGTGAR